MEFSGRRAQSSAVRIRRDAEVVRGLTLEDPFGRSARITHCGEALCSRNHRLGLHHHRGLELMYLVSGSVTWNVEGRRLRQSAGELCLVAAGCPHATAPVPHPEFKALYTGLDPRGLGRPAGRLSRMAAEAHALNLGPLPEVEAVMRGLFQLALAESASPLVAQKFAELLLAMVCGALRPRPAEGRRLPARIFSLPIQRALEEMRRNASRRLTIAELARASCLSPSHFAARFRREVGCAPADYHRRLRLEKAREALRSHDSPVLQVAVEMGFSSSQHLSTLFRQAFGCTPRQWSKAGFSPMTGDGWC